MNNRVEHQTLAGALAVPEDGVSRPSRTQPTSAISQIAALKVGESWSRVERANETLTLAAFATQSAELRDALRNSVQASVRHAKAKTGGGYMIETGDFISAMRNIYLVAVVTRTE